MCSWQTGSLVLTFENFKGLDCTMASCSLRLLAPNDLFNNRETLSQSARLRSAKLSAVFRFSDSSKPWGNEKENYGKATTTNAFLEEVWTATKQGVRAWIMLSEMSRTWRFLKPHDGVFSANQNQLSFQSSDDYYCWGPAIPEEQSFYCLFLLWSMTKCKGVWEGSIVKHDQT